MCAQARIVVKAKVPNEHVRNRCCKVCHRSQQRLYGWMRIASDVHRIALEVQFLMIFIDKGEVGCGRAEKLARVVKPQSCIENKANETNETKHATVKVATRRGSGCVQIRGDLAPTSGLGPRLLAGQNGVSQNGVSQNGLSQNCYGRRMPLIPPSSLHPP